MPVIDIAMAEGVLRDQCEELFPALDAGVLCQG